MPRFFVDPKQIQDNRITITGGDVNHIRNVLRMKKGDELTLCDGQGKDYFCTILEMGTDRVYAQIENSWDSYVELGTKLYLFQGLPKGDKMDLIVTKAVELGAYEVIPVVTARTISRPSPEKLKKKCARWQALAESGAKQSGRGIIPQIVQPMNFEEALQKATHLSAVLMPYERAQGIEASRELIRSLRGADSIGIFIGPEGGFDSAEVLKAQEAGAHTITLGRRILRTETAGLTVLSILMFELEIDEGERISGSGDKEQGSGYLL